MKLSDFEKEHLIYILKKLVQIPTENPPGRTEKVVNFLASEIFREEEGFQNEIITFSKKDVKLHNIITRIGFGNQKIIFSGHFDVVPAGDLTNWDYSPFSAKIFDGRLYGRGSADMKGGITSLIGVMKNLSENRSFLDKFELIFFGTADEEAGMLGALTQTKKEDPKDAILLIIAEPTNLNIGVTEKGLLWANVKVYGKAAHSATPNEGNNAIEGALKIIPYLQNCLEDKQDEFLGTSTLNIGTIKGGTKINVVPDLAELEIDYRLIPQQKHNNVITNLKNIKLKPYSIDVKVINTLPSVKTDINHPFIQNLKQITNSEIIGIPYATEAAIYFNQKNSIPFIIFGPGDPRVVHKPNEWVSLKQVFQATEYLTSALIKTYSI
ncbi:MAG: M20 family metallopeptidase [Candidatus Hodarchaeota archaeon]